MNKIFKVVWSKVRNSYVVVSEVAKANGKSSVKSIAATLAVTAMLSGGTALANTVVTGDYSVPSSSSYVENNGDATPARGGAINHSNGTLTINGAVFEANTATDRGGSIYANGSEITITDSEFSNHKDIDPGSKTKPYGAIYLQNGSQMVLDGTVFKENETTSVHVDDSELILKGRNEFLDATNNSIVLTDGDADLVSTQSTLTFDENSTTIFSGGSGYDFGTMKNNGVVNVESGATVISEAGFTTHNATVFNLNDGTVEIGSDGLRTSSIGVLKGEDGTIAIDADWLGQQKKALKVTDNQSNGTVIKARDLDLKGGAKQALQNVADNLKDTVTYSGNDLEFAAAAVDTALRGELELKDGKVITTMDTDTLVVADDVKAGDVSLVETAQALDTKADAVDVSELQAKTAQISVTDTETSIDVSQKGLEVKGAGEGSFNVYSVGDQTMIYAHNGEQRTFTVDAETGNVATVGGIDAGTDVVAQGQYSLVETAQKTQNITAAEGKTSFATNGDGKITIKDIEGNTMLYGTDADGNYMVGINAQTGGIESKHINVGGGAFVANETGAAVTGSLTVNGNAAVTGGIDAGTDVVAQGKYSLVETAQKLEGKADVADVSELQAKTAGITRTQYQGTTTGETKVTDDFVVDTAEGKGKVTIGYIGENEMLFTTDEGGEYTFGVNAQTGEMQANGGAEIGKRADGTYNVEMNADGVAIQSGLSVAGGVFDVAENGKVTASNGLKVQTSGEGSFSFANIGTGETLFYAMSTTSSSNPTIVMNAQNGNIETQGSLSVGNGAFVSDAASGDAAVKGSLEVGGNAAVMGGIDAGTDVVAQGKYSLVETAQKVEANAEALESVQEQVSANTEAIEQNASDIATNAADIAQNKADIAQNKADIAQNKADIAQNASDIAGNKADIAANKADIAANKAAIDSIEADVSGVVGAVATNTADIATNKADIAQNKADITAMQAVDTEFGNKISENTTNIATNKADIATNKANIAANAAGIQQNANAIAGLGQNVARLDSRMDKVGAGAAALAALHPLDYDPEDKLSFSAGVGNYAGSTAAAVGAFYRPNEDVMFSIGGTAGNGENMVNMGVSFALGKGASGVAKMSKAELVQEVTNMKAENEELKQENKDIRNELNKLKELVMKLAEEK